MGTPDNDDVPDFEGVAASDAARADEAEADADALSLRIAGGEHRDWTEYTVESDLITPADAWRVSLGIPAAALPETVAPWARVELLLGEDTVLTGRVDKVEREIDKDSERLSISGRDNAAVLVDCSAPLLTARQLSLEDAVNAIAKPLGIEKIDVRSQGRREKVEIEPGETAWDALKSVCEACGVWAWCEPDGTLVVGGPDYEAEPVATLVMRQDDPEENNVLHVTLCHDVSGRHSEVTVLGQTHGTEHESGKHSLRHRAVDEDVPSYRPLILAEGECDSLAEAERRAKRALADSRLEGFELRVTVRGHRVGGQEGEPWTPGQRVRVECEPLGLDEVYFLMGRTFLCSKARGRTTELKLKEDGVWLPELNDRATVRSNRKKKKRGEGEVVDLW